MGVVVPINPATGVLAPVVEQDIKDRRRSIVRLTALMVDLKTEPELAARCQRSIDNLAAEVRRLRGGGE